MTAEQFVLLLALVGSVIALKNEFVTYFAGMTAKRKHKLETEAKLKAEAKAKAEQDAHAQQVKDAHDSVVALVKTINGLHAGLSTIGMSATATATAPAPQAQPVAQAPLAMPTPVNSNPQGKLTIEQKLQMLAETVFSQAEQIEQLNATLHKVVAGMEQPAKRRPSTRKGGNTDGMSNAAGMAASAGSALPSGQDSIPMDGLDSVPAQSREGEFEVVK